MAAKMEATKKIPYLDMVIEAISVLQDRSGSSRQAIIRQIISSHSLEDSRIKHIHKALRAGLDKGVIKLARTGGEGARSFKVVKEEKAKGVVKPKKPITKKSVAGVRNIDATAKKTKYVAKKTHKTAAAVKGGAKKATTTIDKKVAKKATPQKATLQKVVKKAILKKATPKKVAKKATPKKAILKKSITKPVKQPASKKANELPVAVKKADKKPENQNQSVATLDKAILKKVAKDIPKKATPKKSTAKPVKQPAPKKANKLPAAATKKADKKPENQNQSMKTSKKKK